MADLAALRPLHHFAWSGVKYWVRQSFPVVPTVTTTQLAQWLRDDPPVLIDARQQEEYAVSHLPQARWAKTAEAVEAMDIPKDKPVVIYCSVGYRSARLADKLQQAGYSVWNLEGSLFEWANEGRSLVTGTPAIAQPTRRVHPYSRLWGLLLKHR